MMFFVILAGRVYICRRLFSTLIHLRFSQILARFFFIFWRPLVISRKVCAPRGISVRGVFGSSRVGLIRGDDVFYFLGREKSFSQVGWGGVDHDVLWFYNLHYFNFLNDHNFDVSAAESWIIRWISANPHSRFRRTSVAWDSYPVSLRLVNWIKWWIFFGPRSRNLFGRVFFESLNLQAHWLFSRLEYHLRGNHLWANAKALVFAGAFFSGFEADRWRETGFRLIGDELREQILSDGAHFELSPMYHAIVLEDILDLLALSQCFPSVFPRKLVADLQARVPLMISFLTGISHSDGLPAQFNDTALGECIGLDWLIDYSIRLGFPMQSNYAARVGVHARLWPSSCYARLALDKPTSVVVLADVGRAGPDYIPGHAHADALSFEMSLGGRRLFVNGGTSTYEASAERLRQRGTRAHNTVCVDGADSSEVWSSFRLGRRIKEVRARLDGDDSAASLTGSFLGFHVLGRPVRHQRTWSLNLGDLVIDDRLEGQFKTAEARLHVAPGWIVRQAGLGVELVSDELRVQVSTTGVLSLERGIWARGFGENIAIDVISIRFTGNDCRCVVRWNA